MAAASSSSFDFALIALNEVKDIVIHYSLSFKSTYVKSDPLAIAIVMCGLVAYACYLISSQSGNYSMVDRLWSIMPVVYMWHFVLSAFMADGQRVVDERLLLMATITTCWGCRLTFNFWRRGGYEPTHEDYRWPLIRERLKYRWVLDLFNFVFISVYQHFLLLLICTPAYVAWRARHATPISVYDYVVAGVVLLFLLVEFVADQQQYAFQEEKYRRINNGMKRRGDMARGFITSGLWKYSRHPNFFAEQAIWCVMYFFSVLSSGQWINWTIIGPVLLVLLFQGSTAYTESITAAKYPDYALYQRSTSMILPWFPGRPLPDASEGSHASSSSRDVDEKGVARDKEEEDGDDDSLVEEEGSLSTRQPSPPRRTSSYNLRSSAQRRKTVQ